MGRLLAAWMLGVAVWAAGPGERELHRFQFARTEMAVPVKIVLYAPDAATATKAADAAFARMRHLNSILSDYDPQSELRRLGTNAAGGRAVPVSRDLWRVLSHAQTLAKRADGAFDVTVGPIVRLWRRARRRGMLPSPQRLESARALVGYRLIRLDAEHQTVELLKDGMRLDLGGIAKGYAADETLRVLKKFGVDRALIDAGGDIVLGDPPPGVPGWRIGIADAPQKMADKEGNRRVLLLANCAVATSGDTWQFVEIAGRRYSHIVDPRTGVGLTDHGSVTVVARRGVTADGLASAVSVLGPDGGLKLIEATPHAAALVVRAPHGKIETYESSRWKGLPNVSSRSGINDTVPGRDPR